MRSGGTGSPDRALTSGNRQRPGCFCTGPLCRHAPAGPPGNPDRRRRSGTGGITASATRAGAVARGIGPRLPRHPVPEDRARAPASRPLPEGGGTCPGPFGNHPTLCRMRRSAQNAGRCTRCVRGISKAGHITRCPDRIAERSFRIDAFCLGRKFYTWKVSASPTLVQVPLSRSGRRATGRKGSVPPQARFDRGNGRFTGVRARPILPDGEGTILQALAHGFVCGDPARPPTVIR